MPIDGRDRLHALARQLKDAGTEGKGLDRELRKALREAADPLAKQIGSTEHLNPYFPDRYAAVLGRDLDVSVRTYLSGDPKVTIQAKARDRKRKIALFNDYGIINHPVYAQGPRRKWNWSNGQTGGMRKWFFTDPCENAAPDVRDRLMQALKDTARKIADGR